MMHVAVGGSPFLYRQLNLPLFIPGHIQDHCFSGCAISKGYTGEKSHLQTTYQFTCLLQKQLKTYNTHVINVNEPALSPVKLPQSYPGTHTIYIMLVEETSIDSKCTEEHPQGSLYNSVLYISHAVEIFCQLWGYLSCLCLCMCLCVCVSQCVCWDITPNNELAEKASPQRLQTGLEEGFTPQPSTSIGQGRSLKMPLMEIDVSGLSGCCS